MPTSKSKRKRPFSIQDKKSNKKRKDNTQDQANDQDEAMSTNVNMTENPGSDHTSSPIVTDGLEIPPDIKEPIQKLFDIPQQNKILKVIADFPTCDGVAKGSVNLGNSSASIEELEQVRIFFRTNKPIGKWIGYKGIGIKPDKKQGYYKEFRLHKGYQDQYDAFILCLREMFGIIYDKNAHILIPITEKDKVQTISNEPITGVNQLSEKVAASDETVQPLATTAVPDSIKQAIETNLQFNSVNAEILRNISTLWLSPMEGHRKKQSKIRYVPLAGFVEKDIEAILKFFKTHVEIKEWVGYQCLSTKNKNSDKYLMIDQNHLGNFNNFIYYLNERMRKELSKTNVINVNSSKEGTDQNAAETPTSLNSIYSENDKNDQLDEAKDATSDPNNSLSPVSLPFYQPIRPMPPVSLDESDNALTYFTEQLLNEESPHNELPNYMLSDGIPADCINDFTLISEPIEENEKESENLQPLFLAPSIVEQNNVATPKDSTLNHPPMTPNSIFDDDREITSSGLDDSSEEEEQSHKKASASASVNPGNLSLNPQSSAHMEWNLFSHNNSRPTEENITLPEHQQQEWIDQSLLRQNVPQQEELIQPLLISGAQNTPTFLLSSPRDLSSYLSENLGNDDGETKVPKERRRY